jgi:hypothetical protein
MGSRGLSGEALSVDDCQFAEPFSWIYRPACLVKFMTKNALRIVDSKCCTLSSTDPFPCLELRVDPPARGSLGLRDTAIAATFRNLYAREL